MASGSCPCGFRVKDLFLKPAWLIYWWQETGVRSTIVHVLFCPGSEYGVIVPISPSPYALHLQKEPGALIEDLIVDECFRHWWEVLVHQSCQCPDIMG